jgi:hypothetical protein
MDLAASRSAFVKQYRANAHGWPDGIGAWYRPIDWDDGGTLLATGEAKARALDPWANDRAAGRPCPALPDVTETHVTKTPMPDVTKTPLVGRPPSGNAMTAAERKRLERVRKGGPPGDQK